MAVQVIMPTFGLTEGEATIVRWLKMVGDVVQADEPLFEAENEKANLEVPASQEGVLLYIAVGEGEMASLGEVVAWIGRPDEQIPPGEQDERTPTPVAAESAVRSPQPEFPKRTDGRIRASPIARRIAREHGIDLNTVQGGGPGGRIVKADLRKALKAKEQAAKLTPSETELAGDLLPLTALRRATAERLAASARSTVPVPLFVHVDMSEVQRLREATRADYEQRLGAACSYNALVICAIARTLRQYPDLNGQWTEEGVRAMSDINIGLAVDVDEGLLVPVIRQADTKNLADTQAEIGELVELARSRRLTPEQLSGGTFTVTNLGTLGIDAFVPVINPPQTAILGVGCVADGVVAMGGQPAVRPQTTLCLVFDHRAVDGLPAASCLARVKQLLENPYLLF